MSSAEEVKHESISEFTPNSSAGSNINSILNEADSTIERKEESVEVPPSKKIKLEDSSTDPMPTHQAETKEPPFHEVVGGSSVRQYLNKHFTQYLLEALNDISKQKPQDPLRELGEYLIRKSDELKENQSTSNSGV